NGLIRRQVILADNGVLAIANPQVDVPQESHLRRNCAGKDQCALAAFKPSGAFHHVGHARGQQNVASTDRDGKGSSRSVALNGVLLAKRYFTLLHHKMLGAPRIEDRRGRSLFGAPLEIAGSEETEAMKLTSGLSYLLRSPHRRRPDIPNRF